MQEAIESILDFLERRGLRRTRARRRIVEAVLESTGHFTPDELVAEMRRDGASASRASAYRTLGLLAEGGFVEARDFGRGQRLFESMVGRRHHDHLICVACRKVVEFENDEIEALQAAVAREHGFTLDNHSLRLYGLCAACRTSEPPPARRTQRGAPG